MKSLKKVYKLNYERQVDVTLTGLDRKKLKKKLFNFEFGSYLVYNLFIYKENE